jgi:P4 family phage/plasmid primase-like protien
MKEIKFDEQEFYAKYIGEITCAYKEDIWIDSEGKEKCSAKRTTEREKYIFRGLTDNVVLIECPKDMLVIEFETHDITGTKNVTKERLKEFVKDTAKNCEKHKLDYCICSHGGTSDYIYVCNIENLIEGKEKDCKKEIANKIIPREAIDFLDLSNLGSTLIPVINRPHWKQSKYHGAIHKIIQGKTPDKHKNKLPDVIIQKLIYERQPIQKLNYDFEEDINNISLTDVISTSGLKKRGNEYQGSNVWHGSETGMNFTVNTSKNVWYCFRCGCGGSVVQAIALNHGITRSCSDKLSSEQFKEVLKLAQEHYGLKIKQKEEVKVEGEKGEGELSYSDLQREVLMDLNLKRYNEASERLANYIEKKYFLYTTKNDLKSEVWIYQAGIYIPNGKSSIKQFCRQVLEEAYNLYIANLVLAKIEADTYIEQKELFDNKYKDELPVGNGILNVRSRTLAPFTPLKIFLNKLPITYDPRAKCPNIDKFFRDILSNEEDILVMYELIGSGLYKDYFTEKAIMLLGSGRNGKSKAIELVKRLVGIENCANLSINNMKEESFSLSELHGKLFNLAGDLSGGDLKDTGIFKQTVGRDILQTKRKFLNDLYFTNYAKHIFSTNELPRVFDISDGFWTKWVLLNFPYQFLTQEEINNLPANERGNKKVKDPDIIDKISTPEELSGLLNCALDGLDRLFAQNNFSQTKGTKEIKDFWIRNSDSFTAFCIDHLEADYTGFVTKRELRRRFNIYCQRHKLKGTSDKNIKVMLEDKFGATDGRKSIDGEQSPIWEGIRFKKKQEEIPN